jgi:pimeloyl-ACP methyl ester carboxylesterase
MRSKSLTALTCAALAGILAVPASAQGVDRSASTSATDEAVMSIPVSFPVENTNNTSVACKSDGEAYTIHGHIVATRAVLAHPDAATLYLHAVTQGEFYWNFKGVPGYDYADQQAGRGHISVTIDRLGYGASDKPPGLASCFGSQADTAHQVVQALRSGKYHSDAASPAFKKVFLAGHSAGGLTATIEAYTFHDIDGLIDFGWADQTASEFAAEEVSHTDRRCAESAAGLYSTPGAPQNYLPFGDGAAGILFGSASSAVRAAVPAPAPDPCGDLLSFQDGIAADDAGVPQTNVPVLLIAGAADMLFPPPALQIQAQRYTSSPKVTYKELADTGHGFGYEASHLQTVDIVDQWLHELGG